MEKLNKNNNKNAIKMCRRKQAVCIQTKEDGELENFQDDDSELGI